MRRGRTWSFWNVGRITKIFKIEELMLEVTPISDLQVMNENGSGQIIY
jgi:hypothetical protein